MSTQITTFSDGSELYFDKGKFDKYCVYYEDSSGNKNAPKDKEYFERL